MAQIVRAASLGGYLECMAALDTDPAPLLREQGLSRHLLANPEHLIPAQAVVRLLERSARASGCRSLGLADGRRATVGKSGQRQPPDPAPALAQALAWRRCVNFAAGSIPHWC
jgi:hypothetical protein